MQDIAAGKPMQKDTIFRIYSMTKAVVSMAAMMLVEEGKLELDDPASKYIPALGKMKVGGKPQEREMTLRDLLRHSAGLPNNTTTDRASRLTWRRGLSRLVLARVWTNSWRRGCSDRLAWRTPPFIARKKSGIDL